MSKIKEIIAEYPEEHNPIVSIALLQALDVLADELHRIGDLLDVDAKKRKLAKECEETWQAYLEFQRTNRPDGASG